MNAAPLDGPIQLSDRASIDAVFAAQQHFFRSGVTRPYAFRKGQLNVLKAAIKRHEPAILEALHADLHKAPFEAYGTEIGVTYAEIDYALKHLRAWMQPENAGIPIMFFPSRGKVYTEPLGTVLIMAPWNYPFMLVMAPLVSAIAAGNTMMLKPSEQATATEKVLSNLISETFEPDYIAIVTGKGEMMADHVIRPHRFDHIFFTGSEAVGKKIAMLAAEQLIPVTLELGGKSPCVIASDARLDFTAKKIAWSKWINAGQTCVAPDYVLVPHALKESLVKKIAAETTRMFGADPISHEDYPRLIHQKRFEACMNLLTGSTILYGGESDQEALYISPTLVEPASADAPVMQEEIFGPILPVIGYETRDEVMDIIGRHPNPLAFYLFTENRATADFYRQQLSFGGGCVNNGLVHLGIPSMPFGGVGHSGMGHYHGKYGFDTFTRKKAMLHTPSWFDVPFWYAPHAGHLKWLKKLMK